jgi:NAD(P)H-dependent FMN reductase
VTASIGVILASVREGRRGEAYAKWIYSLLSERPEIQVEFIDLKEWPLPAYGYRDSPLVIEKIYEPGSLPSRWAEKIRALDGFVIVTPEYTHSYPGSLKNAIDHLYFAWNYKPVAFVSYGGFAAGARAVEQLRLVAIELRMAPVRDEVNLGLIGITLDDRGWPTAELYQKRAAAMIDELLWWTRITQEGRAKDPR